jgi:hypothetical protein
MQKGKEISKQRLLPSLIPPERRVYFFAWNRFAFGFTAAPLR